MINQIDAITIVVSDQDQALDFYMNSLGFEKRFDDEMGDYGRFLMVAPPASQTGIVLFPQNDDVKAGSSFGNVFSTDDIHSTFAELSENGVNFTEEPTDQPWGGIQAQLLDLDGNHWVLVQLPDSM